MADHLRKYEALFNVTPQRMRMIVHSLEETLDKGLQREGEIVVSVSCFQPAPGILISQGLVKGLVLLIKGVRHCGIALCVE